MSNSKVTLAELRKEAVRVFGPGHYCVDLSTGVGVQHRHEVRYVLTLCLPGMLTGNAHRRRMLALLKALPDRLVML